MGTNTSVVTVGGVALGGGGAAAAAGYAASPASFSFIATPIDLGIVKSQSTSGAAGSFGRANITVPVLGTIWYQLVVSNAAGQSTASNVTYSDAVPSNFINPVVVSTVAADGATCPAPTFSGNTLNGSGTTLPASGSCTIVIQATPNWVTDPSNGVVNTATVTTTPTGGNDSNTANNTSSVTTFVFPVMRLNKTVVGTLPAGDSGLFNLSITDANGNASVSPSGGVANPSNNQASGGTTGWVMVKPTWANVAWSDVTVAEAAGTSTNSANYSAFLSCVDGTGAAWPSGGFVGHNTAPAVGNTSNTVVVPQNTMGGTAAQITCTYTNTVKTADLSIFKTQRLDTSGTFVANDIRALSGGVVQYQLVLSNSGPAAANGATFSDALPTNFTSVTVVSATPGAGAACSAAAAGNTVSGTVTTLPVGGTCTVIIQATANALTEMNTGLTNTATVSAPSGVTDPTPGDNTRSVRTFIDGTVTIKKVVVGTLPAGDNGLFNLTFPSAPAFGPALTDATNQGNGGSTLTQRIYPNAAGQNVIRFNETATAGSNLANYTTSTSCSTGMGGSPPASNAFFWVGEGSTGASANVVCTITNTVVPKTDLAIVKSQSTSGVAGSFGRVNIKVPVLGTIWYQLVVSNGVGQSTASNVTYSDAVPSTFINPSVVSSVAAGGATCPAPTFSGNTLSGSGTTLPASGSCTIVIQATPNTVTDPGNGVVNTATVTTTPTGGNDTNTANNSSSVTTFINPVMRLNKTVVGTLPPGDSGLFNLAITGASASVSPSGGIANPRADQGNTGTTGWVMVDPTWAGVGWSDVTVLETAGTSTNSANYSAFLSCVDGAGAAWPSGGFVGHNTAPAVGNTSNVVVVPQNGMVGTAAQIICTYTNTAKTTDLSIDKTQRLGTSGTFARSLVAALVGEVVQYQLVISNGGPLAADGATFNDPLFSGFAGVTVISATPSTGVACSASVAGNTVSGTVATFPVGGTCTVIIQATANAMSSIAGFNNTASVAVPSGMTDTNTSNNASSVLGYIDGTVTIKKAVVGTPPPGDNGLFNLTFPVPPSQGPTAVGANDQGNGGTTLPQRIYGSNPTSGQSNVVTFNETATAGSNLANYNATYSCTNGASGSLAPGSNGSISMSTGNTGGSANVVCTITNTVKTTDLAIVKSQSTTSATGPFITGSLKAPVLGTIWFQLVVSNAAGQSSASNVTYSDAVPSNFINPSVVSTVAAGGATCPAPTFSGNTLSGSGTTLPASGSCTIVIQATPNTVTDPSNGVINAATVTTTPTGGNDSNTANNTSSVTTFINPVMRLNKTVVGTPPAGDSGLFNLLITRANASISTSGGGANPSNDQGNNGTTGWVMVDPTWQNVGWSDVTVAETAGTSTNSANYSAFLSCVDGTGAAWPSGAFVGHNAAPAVGSTSNTVVVPQNPMVGTAAQIICTYTNTVKPKVLIVKTVISGAGSNLFNFALSGLSTGTDSITVVGNATANGSSTLIGRAGTAVTIGESSPAGWPANPVSASCVDSQTALSGNPSGPLGTLTGNVLSIPAANMVNGAAFTCTFTNTSGFSVSGRVFNDNGSGSGTANDGVINGAEAGIAGVGVTLTNCAATTYATTTTNGTGNYSFSVPFGTATGAPLCLQETNLGSSISTGASVGIRPLPSGVAVPGTGTNYTYTRTPDSIAFTFNGTRHSGLNFGDVGLNTFAAGGAKTGQPGNGVTYAHTFTTQTGGSVSFGVASAMATPALTGWSEKIYADPLCTGALLAGATVLFPPALPTVVVAGQQVCVIMQEFIPATALNGYVNTVKVQADFTFTNAAPALSASYQVTDVTTVSSSALDLKKEVRNLTQGAVFGINNQAKSGEVLEYRITYTNNGASAITSLIISDATPSYTRFVSGVDGTTPASLSACQKNTPANALPAAAVVCSTAQAVGGTGVINFQFVGPLNPGATGSVLFQVKVD